MSETLLSKSQFGPMWQTKYNSAVHKIWEWELIFGRVVKAISSPVVRSPCIKLLDRDIIRTINSCLKVAFLKVYLFLGIFMALLESFVPVF